MSGFLIDRRVCLAGLTAFVAGPALAQDAGMTKLNAYRFRFDKIGGGSLPLDGFRGKPFLVVNTACLCGFSPQFAGLQQLFMRYRARGFTIIGVPSNDFGGQDPGSNAEIADFAEKQYGVGFPMAAKVHVTGEGAHPFYKWAARERPADVPRWNFHKYLIGPGGDIAAVFPTQTEPTDPRVGLAVERVLGAV